MNVLVPAALCAEAADALAAADQAALTSAEVSVFQRERAVAAEAERDRLAAELAEARRQTEIYRLGAEIGGDVLYERWQETRAALADLRETVDLYVSDEVGMPELAESMNKAYAVLAAVSGRREETKP